MNADELRELIRHPEGLKLDFKQEFYKIDHASLDVRQRQWAELIKDVLALLNGNVNCGRQTAYLVIGVGDKLKPDGSRDLFGVATPDVVQLRQPRLERVLKLAETCKVGQT